MYSNWRAQAVHDIATVIATLPADATLADRRKALRAHASNFHGGTSWGKKVWSRECRKHLQAYGHPALMRKVEDSKQPRIVAALERGDITFPFRGQP